MILGNAKSNPPPTLLIKGVKNWTSLQFQTTSSYFSWFSVGGSHLTLCGKISSRLYFLKQLKRAGVSSDDLLYFYTVFIRPVFEYASVVWHHNITASQSDKLIIAKTGTANNSWWFCGWKVLRILSILSEIEPFFERRTTTGKTFFNEMCHEFNCLNYLFPDKRDPRFSREKCDTQPAILFHLTVHNAISHLCIMY